MILSPSGTATLAASGESSWKFAAERISVMYVDDRIDNAVPNPANPAKVLYGTATHNVQYHNFTHASMELVGRQGAVAVLQGELQPLGVVAQSMRIDAVVGKVLERSHFVSPTAVGDPQYDYSIAATGVAATLTAPTSLELPPTGRIYSWDGDLKVDSGDGAWSLATGHAIDTPGTAGSVRTEHYVYAWVSFEGLRGMAEVRDPFISAPSLHVTNLGTLIFKEAHGTLDTISGLATADGQDIVVSGGAFQLTASGSTIDAATAKAAGDVAGATLAPRLSIRWPAWLPIATVGLMLGLGVSWPSIDGARRAARDGARHGVRSDRAYAYGAWMAAADARGARWRAAFWAWRAARCQPWEVQTRHELGVMLRQAGRPAAALRQHEKVRTWLSREPDPGIGALNDYNACLCASALGRTEAAIDWLQGAIEKDPGLASEARREPALQALRAHPDFPAITGR